MRQRAGIAPPVTAMILIVVSIVGVLGYGTAPSNQTPMTGNSQTTTSPVPAGMPAFAYLNSTGYSLAKLTEETAPFKALADGRPYGIWPYQSFGYEWGATIPSEEIITFFSPNGLLTIQAYVITAPAPGTTSINQSQIAYARPETSGDSTSGVLLLDLPLNLNGTSSPNIAPSFTPILVFMIYSNNTEYQFFG